MLFRATRMRRLELGEKRTRLRVKKNLTTQKMGKMGCPPGIATATPCKLPCALTLCLLLVVCAAGSVSSIPPHDVGAGAGDVQDASARVLSPLGVVAKTGLANNVLVVRLLFTSNSGGVSQPSCNAACIDVRDALHRCGGIGGGTEELGAIRRTGRSQTLGSGFSFVPARPPPTPQGLPVRETPCTALLAPLLLP